MTAGAVPGAAAKTIAGGDSSGQQQQQHEHHQAPPGLLVSIWRSGLWKFMPYVLIYMIGLGVLFPILPTIITNGFASEAVGHPVQCQVYLPEESPRECRDAHSKAVTMGSWTSFMQGAVLSFLFAPVAGHLSDEYGRKPFMLLGIAIGLLPVLTLMLHVWGWISIIWYYPVDVLNGLISSLGMTLTAVADIMRPEHRAASTAFITAMFSIALIIGPIIGGYLQPVTAVYVCLTTMSLSGVYLFLVVPECAPRWRKPDPHFNHPSAAPPPPPSAPCPPSPATALSTGWRVVASSSWYTRVAIIWGVVSIMSNGTMNVLAQYLQMQLGFTPRDQAHVTVVSASVSLTTKCTILGILITYLGDQWVMAIGLAAYAAEFLMLAFASTKCEALTAIGVGAVGAIIWPATIALQSSRANPAQWGAVSGALQAVGSLASGIGPVVFAVLFSLFSRDPGEVKQGLALPYFPQVIWFVAAGLSLTAVLLACTLHWGDDTHPYKAPGPGPSAHPHPHHAPGESSKGQPSGDKVADEEGLQGEPVLHASSVEHDLEHDPSRVPPTADTWLLGRTWSMRTGLAAATPAREEGAERGPGRRAGRGIVAGENGADLEQPLLTEVDDEVEAAGAEAGHGHGSHAGLWQAAQARSSSGQGSSRQEPV